MKIENILTEQLKRLWLSKYKITYKRPLCFHVIYLFFFYLLYLYYLFRSSILLKPISPFDK